MIIKINQDELKDIPKEKLGDFISEKIESVIKEKSEARDSFARIKASVDQEEKREYAFESNDKDTLMALLTELTFRVLDETDFKLTNYINILKESEKDWVEYKNNRKE